MPSKRRPTPEAVDALVAVAPLVSRWIERLLSGQEPPLTVAQFLALRAIANEELSAAELARRTGVSGPAVSQLLASLVDAGLVERSEHTADRRRHALSLSPAGHKVLDAARVQLRDRLSSALAELPHPEADALARALPQVEARLSGAPPPRRPPPKHHHPPPRR